jgi:hypothetical protein
MATTCPQVTAKGVEITCVGEKRKDRKRSQNPHQPGGDRGDRRGLGDHKPSPGIEKSAQWTVRVADINVFAARLRLHRAQFGVSERAKKRKQPAHQPRQIYELSRAYRLHHLGGNQKNSAADDCSHHHRRRLADAQSANKFGTHGAACVIPVGSGMIGLYE